MGFIVFCIIMFVVVYLINESIKDSKKTSQNVYKEQNYSAPKASALAVNNELLSNVLSFEETAINIARNCKSGGAFLRISVLKLENKGIIELDHGFFGNALNSSLVNNFIMQYSSESADKLASAQDFLKSLTCSYSDWEKIICYFSDMKLLNNGGFFTARKQFQIPPECVPLYFKTILSTIQQKWPSLTLEVDGFDIDIRI